MYVLAHAHAHLNSPEAETPKKNERKWNDSCISATDGYAAIKLEPSKRLLFH